MDAPTLHALCQFTKSVISDSARDLTLLRQIEETIDALNLDRKRLNADADYAASTTSRIRALTVRTKKIDPENKVVSSLEGAGTHVDNYYRALIERRESARKDNRLFESDGVVEAYTDTIAAAADLFNALNDLKWAVIEHDADCEPKGERRTYDASDIEEMFAELDS